MPTVLKPLNLVYKVIIMAIKHTHYKEIALIDHYLLRNSVSCFRNVSTCIKSKNII